VPLTPLPTANPQCVGDCNGDHHVIVYEIITAVNVALDSANLPHCPAADLDGAGTVTVDEIVRAINDDLFDCRPVPRTTPGAVSGMAGMVAIEIGSAAGKPGEQSCRQTT
jgi:hypothetical protein